MDGYDLLVVLLACLIAWWLIPPDKGKPKRPTANQQQFMEAKHG